MASEGVSVGGGDVGVVFEAGDLVVEGGETVGGGGVFESPERSLVSGDAELFGLLVERVDLVAELSFDRPDELVPALPGDLEVGVEILGEAGVLALLPSAEGGRVGGAPGLLDLGFDVAEGGGCLAGVGVLVAAGAGAEFLEVLFELAPSAGKVGELRAGVGGHGGEDRGSFGPESSEP